MLMSSISLSLHKMMLLLLPRGCLNSCLLVLKTPNQILFLNATVPRLALIFFPQTISQYNSTPTKISTSDFYFFNPSSAISQSWVYLLGYWCLLPYYIITYIGDFYNQNAYFPTEFSSFYCHFSLFTCANLLWRMISEFRVWKVFHISFLRIVVVLIALTVVVCRRIVSVDVRLTAVWFETSAFVRFWSVSFFLLRS